MEYLDKSDLKRDEFYIFINKKYGEIYIAQILGMNETSWGRKYIEVWVVNRLEYVKQLSHYIEDLECQIIKIKPNSLLHYITYKLDCLKGSILNTKSRTDKLRYEGERNGLIDFLIEMGGCILQDDVLCYDQNIKLA